jgi:uncharacterized membrane protein
VSDSSFCSVGDKFDCVQVALSSDAIVAGVPLPLWGLAGFSAILAAALRRSVWLVGLSAFAALASLVLLFVALFRIGSVCLLCEVVHVTTWLLLFVAFRTRHLLQRDVTSWSSLYLVLVLPLCLLFAFRIGVPNYWDAFTFRSPIPYKTGVTADGHAWIGSDQPTITLHEFVDYACPHCKAQTARSLRSLAKHPELRLVRRHAPRMRCQSESSCVPLRLLLCASEQGKTFQADRYLFARYSPRGELLPDAVAQDLELERARFLACFNASETKKRADQLSSAARAAHIIDTPTYMRDGKKLRPSEAEELLK